MINIPVRVIFDGEPVRCLGLMGEARKAMNELEVMMRLRGLAQLTTRKRVRGGAMITCSKVFNARTITISFSGGGKEARQAGLVECLCMPHFAIGIVVAAKPPDPDSVEYENPGDYESAVAAYQQALTGSRFMYDILVCTGKRYYLVEDVYSPGWEIYFVDQFVLVSIGKGFSDGADVPKYDFDRDCLMARPTFPKLIVAPISATNSMRKWIRRQVQ